MDSNANVYVTGIGFDGMDSEIYTAKYSPANGALLWERTYGGSGDNPSPGDGKDIAVDPFGDVIVSGMAQGGHYTAKYAGSNGAILWEQHFLLGDGKATAFAMDSFGDVIVSGLSGVHGGLYTVKYSGTNGVPMWEQVFTNTPSGASRAIAVDAKNDVFVTAAVTTEDGDSDYYTFKLTGTNGNLVWQRTFASEQYVDDDPSAIVVDSNGDVIVTGRSLFVAPTFKYSGTNGTLIWDQFLQGDGRALAVDRNDDVLIAGWFSVAKLSGTNGTIAWVKSQFQGAAVRTDPYGDVLVAGVHESGNGNFYVATFDNADGALVWEVNYNGAPNGRDAAMALDVRSDGTIAATGVSDYLSPSQSFTTMVMRETAPFLQLENLSEGMLLQFEGAAGYQYDIERAPNVSGPWATAETIAPLTNGRVQVLDTNAPPTSAFYRLKANRMQ